VDEGCSGGFMAAWASWRDTAAALRGRLADTELRLAEVIDRLPR